jgi:hypothetical protein
MDRLCCAMRIAGIFICSLLFTSVPVQAWDYQGHRTVNSLALSALPSDFPQFVRTAAAEERIAFLSGEPDRWYNSPDLPLRHANLPEHYFDMEDLVAAKIAPHEIPPFRHIFTQRLAEARKAAPEKFFPPSSDPDTARTAALMGYLPWSIAENYGRLKSAFSYLKAYQQAGTEEEIANAEANVVYVMGILGHYVGDGGQPLHTTRHYNGWIGENPEGYTTANTFHAWIDGDFLKKTGGVDRSRLVARMVPARLLKTRSETPETDAIFTEVVEYLVRQHAKVEPLYKLEKQGALDPANPRAAEGRAFIEAQLVEAAQLLANLWFTAWRDAPPDKFLLSSLAMRKLEASPAP